MNQAQLEALLGRPLSTGEVTNLKLYLKIATAQLEEMLCTSIKQVSETRTFDTRENYRTMFTDIFTEIGSVTVDGDEIDAEDYSAYQWDNRNANWYNSIVFKTKRGDCEIDVTADWGFDCYPADLQSLLAGLFGLVSKKNTTNSLIESKQVEDFRVTFKTDSTVTDQFMMDNQRVIDKYSLCNIGEVVSGSVHERCYGYDRF